MTDTGRIKLIPDMDEYSIRLLFVLGLVSLFNSMDRIIFSVLMEPIRLDLGLSDTAMGLLSGLAFTVFFAVFGIPLARLADRSNRIRLLSAVIALWSMATVISGTAQNFVHMFLARAGIGVGEAGCWPISHSLLADRFPPEQRAFALGVFQAGGGVGVLLGLLLAGLVADAVGWRWTFAIIGLPGVILALLVRVSLIEPRLNSPAIPSESGTLSATWASIRSLLRLRTYRQILAAYVFTSAGLFGMIQWLPAFLMRNHDLSLSQVGLWYGPVFGSGAVLGLLTGGLLAPRWVARDRRWELWWTALAYLVSVPLFMGLLMVANFGLVFALLFVVMFISTSGQGPLMAAIQRVAGGSARAMAIALVLVAGVAGQTLGTFLVGWFSDTWQPQFGSDALRYAMMVPLALLAWGVLHLYLAADSLHKDSRD
jgi:predicted MFS family arabinose efflux permease